MENRKDNTKISASHPKAIVTSVRIKYPRPKNAGIRSNSKVVTPDRTIVNILIVIAVFPALINGLYVESFRVDMVMQ